jgi:predicted secreted protein
MIILTHRTRGDKEMLERNPNKKALKAENAKRRSTIANFNTGTRTFKTAKTYNRKALKAQLRKEF